MKITIKKNPPVEFYHTGQVIRLTSGLSKGAIYLIAQVGIRTVNLINFIDGNRFKDPVVVNSASEITKLEMEAIVNHCSFELVEAELIIT